MDHLYSININYIALITLILFQMMCPTGQHSLSLVPRAGRRHYLASLLKKRNMSSNPTDNTLTVTDNQLSMRKGVGPYND